MKFIIMPRGYGKSLLTCKEAIRLRCPILTAGNPKYYKDLCKSHGLPPVAVHTVQEVIDRKFFSAYVIVDDVDIVLTQLLAGAGIIPTLGTMSLDPIPFEPYGGEH